MSSNQSVGSLVYPALTEMALWNLPPQQEVLELFEQGHDPLLRYVRSFGISVHDAEEVTQEVFLCLFRHLQLGRSRRSLRGWIFRVGHNLALKQRFANKISRDRLETAGLPAEQHHDPSPTPEEHVSNDQRRQCLLAVVAALPEIDRQCLRLRADGLRYREIATALGISLGSVSASLARAFERLARVDGR